MSNIWIKCYFGIILGETNLGTIPSTETSKTGCFKTFVTKCHNADSRTHVASTSFECAEFECSSSLFDLCHAEGSRPQISPTKHPETIRLLIYDVICNNYMLELSQNFFTTHRIDISFLFLKVVILAPRLLCRLTSARSFYNRIFDTHTYDIYKIWSQ
jgi:hypothetical protein